jgi:solute:Na+ symporter, SSS family
MKWTIHSELPPPPGYEVSHGFAGSFSGIVNGRLIIAGGANFPDGPPWEGGQRKYWSDIYINSAGDPGEWKTCQMPFLPILHMACQYHCLMDC